MINGAIEAFVLAAAIEMPRGLRINAVSPGVLVEIHGLLRPLFEVTSPFPLHGWPWPTPRASKAR